MEYLDVCDYNLELHHVAASLIIGGAPLATEDSNQKSHADDDHHN